MAALRNPLQDPGIGAPAAGYKKRVAAEAERQQRAVDEMVKELGLPDTGYEFRELIGKGAYGRVYKSVQKATGNTVAVKVLEPDDMDWNSYGPNKNTGMEDAIKEINILRRLQQSKAVNVNMFLDVFPVHSQLWIVSEYCPGGSLTTLRRAVGNKLEERYIRPIARELALGLKSVHAAGIIHRDIKCSNVMIGENGNVQIIDFGVAGILLSNLEVDKRKTVIGTPHWMAPEMQKNVAEIAHGTEVDVWAYGITLFECAMGYPPNFRTMPGRQLQSQIRQNPAPRLTDDRFSPDFRELVATVLEPDPKLRSSMEEICQSSYLESSEDMYPTSSLRELVETYYRWEYAGGQRESLFMQGGAAQPKFSGGEDNTEDYWDFSATEGFMQNQEQQILRLSMMSTIPEDQLLGSPPSEDTFDYDFGEDSFTQSFNESFGPGATKIQAQSEQNDRVARGERNLKGIFDVSAAPYNAKPLAPYGALPLRNNTDDSSSLNSRTIDVIEPNGPTPKLQNMEKIKKRGTLNQAWTFGNPGTRDSVAPMPPVSDEPFSFARKPPDVTVFNRSAGTMNLDDFDLGEVELVKHQYSYGQPGPSDDAEIDYNTSLKVNDSDPSLQGPEEDDGMNFEFDINPGLTLRRSYTTGSFRPRSTRMDMDTVTSPMGQTLRPSESVRTSYTAVQSSIDMPESEFSTLRPSHSVSTSFGAPPPPQFDSVDLDVQTGFPHPPEPYHLRYDAEPDALLEGLISGLENFMYVLNKSKDACEAQIDFLDQQEAEFGGPNPGDDVVPEQPRILSNGGGRKGSLGGGSSRAASRTGGAYSRKGSLGDGSYLGDFETGDDEGYGGGAEEGEDGDDSE